LSWHPDEDGVGDWDRDWDEEEDCEGNGNNDGDEHDGALLVKEVEESLSVSPRIRRIVMSVPCTMYHVPFVTR